MPEAMRVESANDVVAEAICEELSIPSRRPPGRGADALHVLGLLGFEGGE